MELANPERDAKLLADTLQKLGFEKADMLLDGSRAEIATKLKSFADAAANADWAVVYYAGHGIELEGANYLVPVDAKYAEDADIPKESVALDQVLNAVTAAGKLRLVILDACRDNPFTDMKRTDEATVGRGLARIEPEAGTLVAFATKHGRTAADGTGEKSPFATALARRIQTPGFEVNQISASCTMMCWPRPASSRSRSPTASCRRSSSTSGSKPAAWNALHPTVFERAGGNTESANDLQ